MMNKNSFLSFLVIPVLAAAAFSCNSSTQTISISTNTKDPVLFTKVDPTSAPMESATSTPSPTVTAISDPLLYAKVVSAAANQSCAITLSGGLKCWGDYIADSSGSSTPIYHPYPEDIPGLESGVVDVSANRNYTCVLMTSGGVKCWGTNIEGELGDNRASGNYSFTPVDVVGLSSGVKAIANGQLHACALLDTGGVKCWGFSAGGAVGNPVYPYSYVPSDVVGLSGVVEIAVGTTHSCAITSTGGVKCWGASGSGKVLGDGFEGMRSPLWAVVDVKGLSKGTVALAIGDLFTCALMEDGGIKCWGKNAGYYLGDGTKFNRPTPVDVIGLDRPAVAIAASDNTICAILDDGSVACWGQNLLFNPDVVETLFVSPSLISGFNNTVTSISVGWKHACAVMEDQSVMCWGGNSDGQLGIGTTTDGKLPLSPTFVLCPNCEK
jgi:alpha-tubulin suppressor-like RCC1 family protein